MTAKQLAKKLQSQFKEVVSDAVEFRGELTVEVVEASQIAEICHFAKKELGFDYLVDLCTIDNDDETPRWTAVYHLYGYGHLQHLRLKASVRHTT